MNIAPRYLGRGSWLARRDPRVLILVVALFIFTVLQVWDERFVLLLLAIAIVYYRSAGIQWRYIRRNWAVVFVFIGLLVTVNLLVFSSGTVEGLPPGQSHLLFTVPLLGTLAWRISPPSRCASSRLIASPRPVPPYLRLVLASACWNASKMIRCFSFGIPIPVSDTSKATTRPA